MNHDARNHKSKISVCDLQILTVPTKAQFHSYVFHPLVAATCLDSTVIIRSETHTSVTVLLLVL
jgi:hypothetical protein